MRVAPHRSPGFCAAGAAALATRPVPISGLCAFFLRFSITQRDAICRCRPSTRCGMTGLKVAAVWRGVRRSCGRHRAAAGWISYDLARALGRRKRAFRRLAVMDYRAAFVSRRGVGRSCRNAGCAHAEPPCGVPSDPSGTPSVRRHPARIHVAEARARRVSRAVWRGRVSRWTCARRSPP